MNKQNIINEAVQTAYTRVKSIIDLRLIVSSSYTSYMIPYPINEEHPEYIVDIINDVFWKLLNEIKSKVTDDDIEFIEFKSFLSNNPSKELINDCFDIVNAILKDKKSSNETPLSLLLDPL